MINRKKLVLIAMTSRLLALANINVFLDADQV